MRHRDVGVLATGVYVPEIIRRNDWWPRATVEGWERKALSKVTRSEVQPDDHRSECASAMIEAMSAVRNDPFQGSVERRVMPDQMLPSDMEVSAAQDALRNAGLRPDQIGVLMVTGTTPDYLDVSNACTVHLRLGLPSRCFSSTIDAMCNGFLAQFSMVEKIIASGGADYALLVQSSAMSRHCRPEDQFSVWMGDGATAVVVGPVKEGHGVLGRSHRTDGTVFGGIVMGVPGKRWWEGTPYAYIDDITKGRNMFLRIGDVCGGAMDEALQQGGVEREAISFYGSHQATVWFRRVTQRSMRLEHAKYVDTFPHLGSIGGCNIPISLHEGARRGLLKSGDAVAMFSGAAGMSTSCMVMRWGI